MNVRIPQIYEDMASQTHLLIAGATGSGKSCCIQGILMSLLTRNPDNAQLVLIDPKKVELIEYKDTVNAIAYADTTTSAIQVLNQLCDKMDKRYRVMQRKRIRKFTGEDIYVIIDEYADLKVTGGKAITEPVCRLAQLGRACGIHMFLATQRPTTDIIDGKVKVNLDAQVALHTRSKQDSRNIIGAAGAEELPRYGECYYYTPEKLQPERWCLPLVNDRTLQELIEYRRKQRPWWRGRL